MNLDDLITYIESRGFATLHLAYDGQWEGEVLDISQIVPTTIAYVKKSGHIERCAEYLLEELKEKEG